MNNDEAQKTLETIHQFTQFSDAKAGVLITLQTGAMVFFVAAAQEVFTKNSTNPSCAIFLWKALVIMGCFLTIAAVAAAIISIFPRLEVGQPKSNIFFAHVGQHASVQDYIDKVQANDPPYLEDLLNQIWASSKVAWTKYYYVAWSIRFGLVGLTVFIVPWLINLSGAIFS